ncbi:MAG: PH domain-containing protein [Micromonosporaceae bacterium]|nr:PH domain-containing protein [Micromonosporaceae bacterium]
MADEPRYDKKDQLNQVTSGLLQGEQVIAVYDAVGVGTGFIGLTDRRVVLQDKSFVGKRVAITSVPYSKVTAVSVVSNKSWAGSFFSTGNIAIHVGQHTYEVELRGVDKTRHVHNVILHYASGK